MVNGNLIHPELYNYDGKNGFIYFISVCLVWFVH